MSTEKNENEAEKEIFDFTKMYKAVLERSEVPNIEIPFAVQDVISRILNCFRNYCYNVMCVVLKLS